MSGQAAPTSSLSTTRSDPPSSYVDALSEPYVEPRKPYQRILHPGIPIKHALRDHINIYFEEQLFEQALGFLLSLFASADIRDEDQERADPTPLSVPTPPQLAFIMTMCTHPHFTSRLKEENRSRDAHVAAVRFLHTLTRMVTPLDLGFRAALVFQEGRGGRTRSSQSQNKYEDDDDDMIDEPNGEETDETRLLSTYGKDRLDPILSDYALEGRLSLWTNARDFWAVIGWAFSCSVRSRRRWELGWRVWLEWFIDVLDADWQAQENLLDVSNRDDEYRARMMSSTLIATYADCQFQRGAMTRPRRIVNAIFANGDEKSKLDFPEVWKHETRRKTREDPNKQWAKRPKLDLDDEEPLFPDYNSGDDTDEEVAKQALSLEREDVDGDNDDAPRDEQDRLDDAKELAFSPSLDHDDAASLGGVDVLSLRLNILNLLARMAASVPTLFTDTTSLYQLLISHFRNLPLKTFRTCFLPQSGMPPSLQFSVGRYMLANMLDEPVSTDVELSWPDFQQAHLLGVNRIQNVSEVIRVTILLRVLLDGFDGLRKTEARPSLQQTIDTGIKSRKERAGKVRKGSSDARLLDKVNEELKHGLKLEEPNGDCTIM